MAHSVSRRCSVADRAPPLQTALQIPERVMWCHDTTTVRHVEASAGDVVLCERKPPPAPALCIISELAAGV